MTGPSHAIQSWIKAIGRLLVLIALLAVLQESVRLYLTAQLKAQLQAPLPDNYILDFQRTQLNWRQQRLQIRQLSLKPEVALPPRSTQIDLLLPSIRLDLRSIFSSLRNGKLIIDDILIESPRISFEQAETQEANFTQASLRALGDLSQYLSLLQIQKLEVKKAKLDHKQWRDTIAQNLHFSEINLLMSKFSVDSSLRRHSFLNADQVELEILGQRLLLPQKDHQLQFDTLQLSTSKSQIRFAGLSLQPITKNVETLDLITINSPLVLLDNIDFESSYLNQTLDIGQLKFETPSIHFSQQKVKEQASKGPEALKDAITQLTRRIQIETIEIKEADIDLDLKESDKSAIRFELDSILIYDFAADSSTTFSDIDYLPFRDIQLYLSNIRQYLNPQIGPLSIQSAQLNSSQQQIIVANLQIGDSSLKKQRFYQHIPHLQFDGIDIFDVLLEKQASVQQISCFQPATRIRSDQNEDQSAPDKNFYLTLSTFFRDFFLEEISSQKLIIQKGTLLVEDQLEVAEYHYLGQNIELNAQAAAWSRIVPSFSCQARNYHFQMGPNESIWGDSLFLNGEAAEFYGLSFKQKDTLQKLHINASALQLQGLKIDSLFVGQLYADSLKIDDPQIDYIQYKINQRNTPTLPVHIPLVILNHGRLAYQSIKNDKVSVEGFDGVFTIQDSISTRYSRFEDLSILTNSETYCIDIDKGQQFDNPFSYEFNGIQLTPMSNRSILDSALTIPNLRVFNWDPSVWKEQRLLKFQKLIADRPQVSLSLPDSAVFKQESRFSLPIQLDTLLLFNALLDIESLPTPIHWNFPSITLALYALDVPAAGSFPQAVGSMLLGLDQGLQIEHPDYSLRTAPIFYNSKQKKVQTDLILYQGHQDYGLIRGEISQLNLGGIDPAQLKAKEPWQLSTLNFDSAYVHFRKAPDTIAHAFTPEKWAGLSIKQIDLGNINARLELDPLVEVKNAAFSGREIVIDTNWQAGKLDQAWQSLHATAQKISFAPDQDKHYQLLFGLDYQSDARLLRLASPELRRNLSTKAFARQLNYRTDYWQLKAKGLIATDFHPALLFRDTLHFPKLALRQLTAHDYNDERIPLSGRYKAMLPDQIKDMKLPFLIDTLAMTGDITYSAIAPLTGDSSWISFNEIDGRIYHVTNIPALYSKDMRLEANALLYNEAPLEVEMQFQLDHQPSTFELSGSLQDLDLTALNPILRGQTALSVTKGRSSKLLFNLAANDSVAVGELLFRYKKLRVQLLDKEDLSNRSAFLSFWTNRLIQSRNPNWLRRRKGIIYFERDQQKAISHYWAHSLLSGIVSSIGVKNTRRRLRKANLDIDDFSYETLLKEQLKRPKEGKRQK